MMKARIAVALIAVLAIIATFAPSNAIGSGGSKTWPVAIAPIPTPGTVILNSEKKIVTTTTNTVAQAESSLDQAYIALGWTLGRGVNEPRTYTKVINGKRIKIIVFYAALDPTPANGFIRAQLTQTWNQL